MQLIEKRKQIVDKYNSRVSKFKLSYDRYKHNIYFYGKLIIFLILAFIWLYFPSKWIQFGIVPALFEIGFFYITLNLIITFLRRVTVRIYLQKQKYTSEHYDNFTLGIERISHFLIHFIFLISLLYFFGIDIKLFLTSISIFAVAIVLIFKEYISNFIN